MFINKLTIIYNVINNNVYIFIFYNKTHKIRNELFYTYLINKKKL